MAGVGGGRRIVALLLQCPAVSLRTVPRPRLLHVGQLRSHDRYPPVRSRQILLLGVFDIVRCAMSTDPKLSTTSYAVLGLLGVRPWSTYELADQMSRALRWFWPRAQSNLYEAPKRLAAQGL